MVRNQETPCENWSFIHQQLESWKLSSAIWIANHLLSLSGSQFSCWPQEKVGIHHDHLLPDTPWASHRPMLETTSVHLLLNRARTSLWDSLNTSNMRRKQHNLTERFKIEQVLPTCLFIKKAHYFLGKCFKCRNSLLFETWSDNKHNFGRRRKSSQLKCRTKNSLLCLQDHTAAPCVMQWADAEGTNHRIPSSGPGQWCRQRLRCVFSQKDCHCPVRSTVIGYHRYSATWFNCPWDIK